LDFRHTLLLAIIVEAVKLIITNHHLMQTIAQIENNSRCSNCGRRGRVELVIYFRNAVDVKRSESVGI
jgi:hypothetical protein